MNDRIEAALPVGRRQFLAGLSTLLGATAVAGPAIAAQLNASAGKNSAGIPLRTLGRTKEKVTILGLGCAPVGHSMPGAAIGVPVYRAALEAGINYVDAARGYDDAEKYLGELMPSWRDKIFLVTKALPQGDDPRVAASKMQESFETSLRLMKTDHVDLLHIHSIGSSATPEVILARGGPLEFVRRMKAQGKTRYIGVSGHNRSGRFGQVIETGEIDVVMVALNFIDEHTYRFEQETLPMARKHGCGLLAMKVFGGHRGGFAGYRQRGPSKMPAEYLERAMRYALTIEGVASAVIGPYTVEEARQNVEWAKRFTPLTSAEQVALREKGKAWAADWGPRFGPVA